MSKLKDAKTQGEKINLQVLTFLVCKYPTHEHKCETHEHRNNNYMHVYHKITLKLSFSLFDLIAVSVSKYNWLMALGFVIGCSIHPFI